MAASPARRERVRFSRPDDRFVVVRITGPRHNYLAFRLGEPGSGGPRFVVAESGARRLDLKQVEAAVLAGLARAREAFEGVPEIGEVEFIWSDTGPEMVYEKLAYGLAGFVASEVGGQSGRR